MLWARELRGKGIERYGKKDRPVQPVRLVSKSRGCGQAGNGSPREVGGSERRQLATPSAFLEDREMSSMKFKVLLKIEMPLSQGGDPVREDSEGRGGWSFGQVSGREVY